MEQLVRLVEILCTFFHRQERTQDNTMAHFAKIDENNLVVSVVVVSDSDANNDADGQAFLNNLYKTTHVWKQTSYNTNANVHLLGGTAFRKNYAGLGYTYDAVRDAFIPPKIYNSWTLNETTCVYEPPVAHPNDGNIYTWDEDNKEWAQE